MGGNINEQEQAQEQAQEQRQEQGRFCRSQCGTRQRGAASRRPCPPVRPSSPPIRTCMAPPPCTTQSRAVSTISSGSIERRQRCCSRATALQPNNTIALVCLGTAATYLERGEEAVQALLIASTLKQEEADGLRPVVRSRVFSASHGDVVANLMAALQYSGQHNSAWSTSLPCCPRPPPQAGRT